MANMKNQTNTEKNLPNALITWYDFVPNSKALFLSGGDEACEGIFDALQEKKIHVVKATVKKTTGMEKNAAAAEDVDVEAIVNTGETFDSIVGVGILEKCDDPVILLRALNKIIKPDGKMLFGVENRLGIRYFCGDKDPFSKHVYDGIDGYRHIGLERKKKIGGRLYAKSEWKEMLSQAGFASCKFYSVMPWLTRPQILLAEDYLPNEPLAIRIFPQYNSPETIFLEEERLYQTLLDNQMFHQMANAYLVECSPNGILSDIDQITVQSERTPKEALATMIKKKKEVRKKALYPAGEEKIQQLLEKNEYLRKHGVLVAKAHIKDSSYVMPYIEGTIATEYFQELLQKDKSLFLQELSKFREQIESSSEHVPYEKVNWREFEPDWKKRKKDDPNIDQWEKLAFGTKEEQAKIGVILKRGFIDMVSLNCFHTDEGYVFFDQEFDAPDYPANAIFLRTLDIIYSDRSDLEQIYPQKELLEYFGLLENCEIWRRFAYRFLENLRNENELSVYHRIHKRDWNTVVANRHRMNYSKEEYEKLFTNIFKDVENKKVYLFGSGVFAQKFIEQFGNYYEIAGIVDNNGSRWGQELNGIKIISPAVLQTIEEPFKVFICIKYFDEVLRQIKEMGIRNYSVYDFHLEYDRPLKITAEREENAKPKKYHIGYVAGVFDLFHVGHVNLLRRAKEQCDYLIVGIVSDEQVINGKKTKPYMPFEDRLAILQSCRYVDEAVRIPPDKSSTADAYRMYHFDVQFSGSDYENDPIWLSQQAYLRQHGSDIVFFPYTQSVSSTQLKEQIFL